MKLSHFSLTEFVCPCCGQVKMDEDFLRKLDYARDLAGVPFRVTSGFRCPRHNHKVGGKPDSAHLRGLAADIAAGNSDTRARILFALIKAGFQRIGIDFKRGFIHVDDDPEKPRPRVWGYLWPLFFDRLENRF